MWSVKIKSRASGEEQGHPCERYIARRIFSEGGECVGRAVELLPDGPQLELPRDGDEVFVMNSEGTTVAIIRWPDHNVTNGGRA